MFTGLQLRGLLRQDREKSLISGPSSVELGWFLSDGNNDNLEGISFASFGDLVVSTSSFRYPICGLSGSFDFENIFYLAIRRVSLGYSALPRHISFPYSGAVERVEILDEGIINGFTFPLQRYIVDMHALPRCCSSSLTIFVDFSIGRPLQFCLSVNACNEKYFRSPFLFGHLICIPGFPIYTVNGSQFTSLNGQRLTSALSNNS
ncbi:uncharacterized protein K444DRAFT_178439 [Hyaloscypha bicolor E]|uniref:Uncharacterized protein n=1 Tax=Hyaloscypha bicolor E TaxID=1095630 RepID=A0A2J6TQR4_9HELO|nr:uncharacterized protein K444DRAFT_178439 [Hyaloscypha bicolor E]PMD65365.1 hypothetical protein K444DRAFT_178439 [Hyaloscypha bicolor E]